MDEINFEESSNNLLLESATEMNLVESKNKINLYTKTRAPESQCFQSLKDFNASLENISEDNWCSGTNLESDSDDTLFASCKLNISLTPTRACRTIVDQIILDFCSSPLSPNSLALEERMKLQEYYRSPCFKFNHKNVRVYSNTKRRKLFNNDNIREKEEECEDDDCLSISSGLSVQEDLTQPEVESEDNNRCTLNKSQNIYENLLNLSAFFTQPPADNIVNDTDIKPEPIDIVEQTLDMQQIEFNNDAAQISNEVLNFNVLSEGESDSMSETPDCSKTQTTSKQPNHKVAEDAPLFSDGEGDEFFMNINSQDVLESTVKVVNTNIGEIEVKENRTTLSIFSILQNTTKSQSEDFGFKTAGKKQIKISNAAINRASKLIADVIELHPDQIEELSLKTENLVSKEVNLKFDGFQTAGNKSIKISEKSKNRASKLKADVMELKLDKKQYVRNDESINVLLPKVLPELSKDIDIKFVGFQTAGNKSIKISEKSKNRASKLIADVMKLDENNVPLEKRNQNQNKEKETPENSRSLDKNSIIDVIHHQDLESSDEKEDFKGFPEISKPNSRVNHDSTITTKSENRHTDILEEFADIQFSEWPHDGGMVSSQPKDDIPEPPLPMLDITDSNLNPIANVKNVSKDGNIKLISRRNLLSLSNRRKRTTSKGIDPPKMKTKVIDKQEIYNTPKDNMQESKERFSTPVAQKLYKDMPVSSTPTSNAKTLAKMIAAKKEHSKKTPTASERIELLSRYGEPPDLSPIPSITPKGVDNCKPSGLRRTIRK